MSGLGCGSVCWLSVGPRKGRSGWRLSAACRVSVGPSQDMSGCKLSDGLRRSSRVAWIWSDAKRSACRLTVGNCPNDWRENASLHKRLKRLAVAPHDFLQKRLTRLAVAPHDSQNIRNAIWHGAVLHVACGQLTPPDACG